MQVTLLVPLLLCAALAACNPGFTQEPVYTPRSIDAEGITLKYVERSPAISEPARCFGATDRRVPLPLVVFFHGMGECGEDNQKHLTVGLPRLVRESEFDWPCWMLIPQKPDPNRQWEDYEPAIIAMVERFRADNKFRIHDIVLTGLSQGGHGTWVLGSRHPDLWTRLAPICGYASPLSVPEIAAGLSRTPVWTFHGLKDTVVAPDQTRALVKAVQETGNRDARETLYPDAGHNCWDAAYADPALRAWLLAPARSAR